MQVDYLALSHVKEEMDILDINDLLIGLNDNNIQLKIEEPIFRFLFVYIVL